MNQYEPITANEPLECDQRFAGLGEPAGGPARERQLLSLGAVVRDALPLLRAAIADTALLRIAVDQAAPLVLVSPIVMQRVLLNLVLNASRAIRQPHGVIEIGVACMSSSDASGPPVVRLTVADNGIGMDGAAVGDLRQSLAESAAPEGAGLGLRFVHREVCAHGGRLQFESQPGSGTTVRIDLPIVSQQLVRRQPT
jgi:signal transduction histidine kinase